MEVQTYRHWPCGWVCLFSLNGQKFQLTFLWIETNSAQINIGNSSLAAITPGKCPCIHLLRLFHGARSLITTMKMALASLCRQKKKWSLQLLLSALTYGSDQQICLSPCKHMPFVTPELFSSNLWITVLIPPSSLAP